MSEIEEFAKKSTDTVEQSLHEINSESSDNHEEDRATKYHRKMATQGLRISAFGPDENGSFQ